MLSSGYTASAGSGRRCPAVTRTATTTGTTAITGGPEPRLARTAARPAVTTTATTATTCTTSSASRATGWKCVAVSGQALLNGAAVSGSVARMTVATTVSALATSRAPNLAVSFATATSTSPQASHSGASRSANS